MPPQDPEPMIFLRLRGRLRANGELVLRPGYLVTERRDVSARGPWLLVAEVRSPSGELLSRTPLTVRIYCSDGSQSGPTGSLSMYGDLPVTEQASRIEIIKLDPSGREPVRVATIEMARSAPSIRLIDVPQGHVSGEHVLRWDAGGDPPPVQFRVRYSHDDGRTWHLMARPTAEREVTVNFDEFPGGEQCRVAVLATNGTRSTEAISPPFSVAEKSCRALIQQPPPNARLDAAEVVLLGNGWWLESMSAELEELEWTSDRQGALGRGRTVRVALAPGHHVITLRAGRGPRAGEASVEVDVAPAVAPSG
jgi:hypothetical protein